jgi:hypothetical protein
MIVTLFLDFEVIRQIISCGIVECLGNIVQESTKGPLTVFQIHISFSCFIFIFIDFEFEELNLILIGICGIHCEEEDSEMS